MITINDSTMVGEPKLAMHDMTPEELYAVIEQEIKAIYEEDDTL